MALLAHTTRSRLCLKLARVAWAALRRWVEPRVQPLAEAAGAMAAVFMCGRVKVGALLLGVLLWMPRFFVAAVVACLLGAAAARGLRLPQRMLRDGTLLYNVLLGALAVGWLSRGSDLGLAATGGLLVVVTLYSLLLSAALWHWFPLRAGLPPLSLGFTVVFGTLLTLFPRWAAAATLLDPGLPTEPALPFLLTAFLRSLGTILFLPNGWCGLTVLVALLVWSRLAVVHALVGYVGGALVVWLLEACGLHWQGWLAGHNYLLAGMALGAVYFVPSRQSLLLSLSAGAVAALNVAAVQHLLRGSGWEYLPLPYLLTVWGLLCALRLRESCGGLRAVTGVPASPEQAAVELALEEARFPHRNETHVLLPTAREVTVTQGFDGPLSHRGEWRYALDLEVHDAAGNACPPGCADDLTRYHTQGLEVRAPGLGEVLQVCDGVPDNAPGGCNFAQSWGNYVVLRLDYGGVVKLAHLTRNGILVKTGQRVMAGELLGYCGNSGRSPVPHVHLHAQASAEPAAPTVPFCVANFYTRTEAGLRWRLAGVPQVGERVSPAVFSATVLGLLAHLAPGTAVYESGQGQAAAGERLAVLLNEAGHYVFTCGEESLTLVLGLHALQCTQQRLTGRSQLLRLLALVLTTVPYACQSGMTWEDCVRLGPGRWGWLGELLSPYAEPALQRVELRHVLHPTPQRLHLGAYLPGAPASLPRELELTLEPVRGVTTLTARFSTHTLTFAQTCFTPTLPNGDAC